MAYLNQENFEKRGWIFAFQPSQSPITNIHDAYIFSALSRTITIEQGVTNGSPILKGEQLWNTVR